MSDSMLRTKHNIPLSGSRLLLRRQLNQKLNDALACALTVITAPAGYGKTTAVVKWLEGTVVPHAWLSVDAEDNDPSVFWRYFCTALGSFVRDIEKDLDYVFASRELLLSNIHLNVLIDRMFEMQSDFIYVLDDMHLIDNRQVLNALSSLIHHIPANIHILLLSRTTPDLNLHRLDLKENLLYIKTEDLRFDAGEIDTYLKMRGHILSEDELDKVERYTEGWAAALVAVSLSFRDEKNIQSVITSFKNCNLRIEDYLIEDVMKTWTAQQQDFMIRISILERFCAPLCCAVSGCNDDMLSELYRHNSFLIVLDEDGEWFRFHHLFRDYLRSRLAQQSPKLAASLHQKAGEWLAANDLCEQAMAHFLQGGHFEQAAALVDPLWDLIRIHGSYSNIISLISQLPEAYTANQPAAMYFEIFHAVEIEDFAAASKSMEKLDRYIATSPCVTVSVRLRYLMCKANLYLAQFDFTKLISTLAEASSYSPKAYYDYMDFNMCDISAYRARTYEIIKMYLTDAPGFFTALGRYRATVHKNAGYVSLIVGESYYESGQFNEALPLLAAAVDEARGTACPGALVPAMVTIAKIKRAGGDFTGALAIVEECENQIALWNKPHWLYIIRAFKARLHLEAANMEAADRWIADSRLGVFQEITSCREYELIVLSRMFIAKRRCDDASLLLCRLLGFAEAKNRVHSAVEICNLLAINAKLNEDEEAAYHYIEKSLHIGMKEGFVRSFADELFPMTVLLKLYLGRQKKRSAPKAYAKKLLEQTEASLRLSAPRIDINSAEKLLTPAERKVLQLLMRACTYNEISAELGITLSTVKSHASSVYKKLGVKSRAQCMSRLSDIPCKESAARCLPRTSCSMPSKWFY